MKNTLALAFLLFMGTSVFAQKTVYIPRFITNQNMDLNDPSSQWAYSRSVQTPNFIVFWEAGYGSNPSTAASPHQVNMNALLEIAERSYAVYLDSLGFAERGSSVLDKHKMIIFVLYSTEWAAYGSGQDNLVGTLHVNGAAARSNTTLAHEIGHCFQYITGCDTQGGYRYGYGLNASGGNGFWEQCANWMAFKVYPGSQFGGSFSNYIRNNHLHILHESPRYANYFIQDYWTYKRGKKFMGRLWRESLRPEDPVETYKRLNSISQTQFNDEIYEHAARLTTWDIPAIKSYGSSHISSRAQVKMNLTTDNFWKIDPTVCIENYGYNSIQLNAPSAASTVTVHFKGLAGESGFRALNINQGGWRYGFVALLKDGSRFYSPMASAQMENGLNPQGSLSFACPANSTNLWLVVSGAPQQHWKHAWDDDNSNDEHWPYSVQFENTNLLGVFTNPIHDVTLTYDLTMDPRSDYTPNAVTLNSSQIAAAFAMTPQDISRAFGSTIRYYGINPNGTLNETSTANAPGHWYTNTGATIAWGNGAFIFSELNMNTLVANIGQYPDRCQPGDQYTIRQALMYTKSPTETARVSLVFNIAINPVIPDNQAPEVSITAPAINATYTAPTSIFITASATDSDGTVSSVEFYNGTTLLATDATAPYSFTWNNVAAGTYTLTARATDNSAAVTTSAVRTVVVIGACTPSAIIPYIQINGGLWRQTSTPTLTIGGAVRFGPQPVTGGSWRWTGPNGFSATVRELTLSNIETNQAGNYIATYTNASGCTSTHTFSVTVTLPLNLAPAVSLTVPANNATFTAPANISLTASATDSDGSVAKVEFFNGSAKLGEDLTSPYSFAWSGVAAGSYQLTARATDNSGTATTSSSITVIVSPVENCLTKAIPAASDWIVRNDWADQNSGTVLTNTTEALRLTHRQWGRNFVWMIESSAKKINVQAGRTYTISFDFRDDAANKIASLQVGLASAYAWNEPTMAQPLVSMPSGTSSSAYTNKMVNLTASVTGDYYLVIRQQWSGQPSSAINNFIKDLEVCENGAAIVSATIAESSIAPNPTTSSFTLGAVETIEFFTVSNNLGTVVYNGGALAENAFITFGESLPTGNYVLRIMYSSGRMEAKTIQKLN